VVEEDDGREESSEGGRDEIVDRRMRLPMLGIRVVFFFIFFKARILCGV
jgi:hypothetical protein